MPIFLTEIDAILTTPPGNLVYHLLLAAFIVASLAIAIHLQRSGSLPQAGRMVTGLTLLLLVRLGLFGAAAIAWQGFISEGQLLPPIDRAVSLLSLTILLWMWLFPNTVRAADVAHILLGLLVLTTLGLTLAWWSGQPEELTYNGMWPDFIGSVAQLVLLGFGVLVLLARRPTGWGPGLGMFVLLALGQAAHLYFAPEGDFSGLVRLAEIMAYPLLILLALRFPIPTQTVEYIPLALPSGEKLEDSSVTTQAWLSLLSASTPAEACPALTRLVAQFMGADLCLLLRPPDEEGLIFVECAFEPDQAEPRASAAVLDSRKVPVIASTLRLGRPVRIPANSTSPDLSALAQALDLVQAGSLLSAPILYPEQPPAFALLLLTPFSRRNWTADDQEALIELSRAVAQLLHRLELLVDLQNRLVRSEEALQASLSEREAAGQERDRLRSQLEALRQEAERDRAQAAGLAALLKTQESGLKKGTAQQASESAEIERLQGELTLALEEIARLKSAVPSEYAAQPPIPEEPVGELPPHLASIVGELNRPADSVIEYANRLLSTSALDDQQRKFIERIKISGERMRSLVEDLLGALSQPPPGEPGTVELQASADAAIARLAPQIKEKGLWFRQDIPTDLPALHTDPKALERLILLLLGDAVTAAPSQGDIGLSARLQQKSGEPDYLLISVEGKRAPLPSGDSGARLRIEARSQAAARSLAEVLQGRLWSESDPAYGSRTNLLIPVSPVELKTAEGIPMPAPGFAALHQPSAAQSDDEPIPATPPSNSNTQPGANAKTPPQEDL